MLFILYLKRIAIPLSFAILATLTVMLSAPLTIMGSVIIMTGAIYQFTAYHFFHWLFKKNAPQFSQKFRRNLSWYLGMCPTLIASTLLTPHLFLFFNALPFLAALTLLSFSAFLVTFELAIRIPELYLGSHYSLLKIILHPTNSICRLKRMLKPGIESLKLEESERKALETRQQAAIAQLPKEAIIDDVKLYQKYLKLETKRVAEQACFREQLTAHKKTMQLFNIKTNALKNAKKDALDLENSYLNTLTPAEQERYKHYRALTCEFSPPYAECLISRESVNDEEHDHFVIVEKRFSDSNTCVPNITFFWHDANGFKPLFNMQQDPSVPSLRDSFSSPRDEDGQAAEYFYHRYSTLSNHALSLQLCEAIENFNQSLTLSATRRRQQQVVSNTQKTTTMPGSHRYAPPAKGTSLGQRNMFASKQLNARQQNSSTKNQEMGFN